MICQKCGKENPDTNKFCGGCGEILKKTSPNNALKMDDVLICPKCQNDKPTTDKTAWRKSGLVLLSGKKTYQKYQCLLCGCQVRSNDLIKPIAR